MEAEVRSKAGAGAGSAAHDAVATADARDHSVARSVDVAAAELAHLAIDAAPASALDTRTPHVSLFILNGHVTQDAARRGTRLYVNPSSMAAYVALRDLVARSEGGMFSLHGPRQSGKTTCIAALCAELAPRFSTTFITFQSYPPPPLRLPDADVVSASRAWWADFEHALTGRPRSDDAARERVRDWLCKPRAAIGASTCGLPVIIVFDEADILYDKTHPVFQQEFLNFWRGVKEAPHGGDRVLHAVLLAGTFAIRILNSTSGSPFNVAETFYAPTFTEEGTTQLFVDFYRALYGAQPGAGVLDTVRTIASDVYLLTGGHAGLTVACGKCVEQECVRRAGLALGEWQRARDLVLPSMLAGLPTGSRMVTDILELPPDKRSIARNVLQDAIVAFDNKNPYVEYVASSSEAKVCSFLVAAGALFAHADTMGKYRLLCPLVRPVLDAGAVCAVELAGVSTRLCPGTPDEWAETVCTALAHFPPATMREATTSAFKLYDGGTGTGIDRGTPAPCEAVYDHQIVSVLQGLLQSKYVILSQARGLRADHTHMDVLVKLRGDPCAVLEVSAHERRAGARAASVSSHITRTMSQYMSPTVGCGIVVNFFLHPGASAAPISSWEFQPDAPSRLRVMYVFHDTDWTRVRVVWKSGNGALRDTNVVG